LLQLKFLYALFIGRYSGTFDTYTVLFNRISGIYSNLVVGFVAVLHSQIIIFNIEFEIG
jgi:hypothetical protein